MTDLPRGWASGLLSDFVTPRGEKVSPADFPDMPFIGMDHVEAHTTRIVGSVPSRQMKSAASRFSRDNVLYGRLRPYLNKVAQSKFDGLASGEFIVFEGNQLIDPGFLRYRMHAQDFVSFASHLNEGDRPRVNFDQIGEFEVLVPPPEEQRRIVKRIETLFDEIEQGVASLRDAKKAIGLYRQSLLKSAFEGRLTADWRARNHDKLQTPDTFVARIHEERERRYEAALDNWERAVAKWRTGEEKGRKPAKPKRPAGFAVTAEVPTDVVATTPTQWLWLSLSELGQVTGGLTKNQKRNGLPQRAKYLRVANVYSNRLELDEIMEIGITEDELRKTRLVAGDLLFVEGNGSIEQIGRVAIWNGSVPDMTHQNHLIRFSANGLLSSRFALYFMMSPIGRERITIQASSTSGLHTLSISKVGSLPVPVCSPAEQAEVVRIIDDRLEATETLEAEIDTNLARADALRQSILKKAFAGKLVPQDPTDEPATILLQRIEAERASQKQDGTTRKREARIA